MPRLTKALAVRAKAARAQTRKDLGHLRDHVINSSTLKRYVNALRYFFWWLSVTGTALPSHAVALDLIISEFIEMLWQEGEGRSFGHDTISGICHHVPSLHGKFYGSKRLLSAWQRLELPARAPPLTRQMLLAAVELCLRRKWLWLGACLALGFHCFLRTGEMFPLTPQHFSFDGTTARGVVRLGLTKSGQRRGVEEASTIDCPMTGRLVQVALLTRNPEDFLIPSCAEFRKKFDTLMVDLGLSDFEFKPYSLRRGGTTFDFRQHGVLSRSTLRGRWANARTARLYINDSLAVLTSLKLPPVVAQKLEDLEAALLRRFAIATVAPR